MVSGRGGGGDNLGEKEEDDLWPSSSPDVSESLRQRRDPGRGRMMPPVAVAVAPAGGAGRGGVGRWCVLPGGALEAERGGASFVNLAAAASHSGDRASEGFLPDHCRRGRPSRGKVAEWAGLPPGRGPPNAPVDHPGLNWLVVSWPGEQAGIPGGYPSSKRGLSLSMYSHMYRVSG